MSGCGQHRPNAAMTADDVVTFGAGYHGACSCAPNRYQAVPSQRALGMGNVPRAVAGGRRAVVRPVLTISDASQDAVRQARKTSRSARLSPQPASPSRNLAMLIQV